jgi:hypothetical protein
MQRLVLHSLALRMNWKSGTGYASTAQLMADADASKATAKRATSWARRAGLLLQTRRGHRLGSGQVAASEWKLLRPVDNSTQGLTGEPLNSPQGLNGEFSRAQQNGLKGSAETPHQELSSSRTSASPRGRQLRCPRGGRAAGTGHMPGCPSEDATALGAIIDGVRARQ